MSFNFGGSGTPAKSSTSGGTGTNSSFSFGGGASTPSFGGGSTSTSTGSFGFAGGDSKAASASSGTAPTSFGFGSGDNKAAAGGSGDAKPGFGFGSGDNKAAAGGSGTAPTSFGFGSTKPDSKSGTDASKFSLPCSTSQAANNTQQDSKQTQSSSSVPATSANDTSTKSSTGITLQSSQEYSTLTLDGIINNWTDQLKADIDEYEKQSKRVAAWDKQLRENQKELNGLMDSVHRILVDQEDLDGSIQAIETYQRELDDELDVLSRDVDEHLKSVGNVDVDESAYAREEIYSVAADLDQYLTKMHENLERIVQEYNNSRGGAVDGSEDEYGGSSKSGSIPKILEVLNTHHDSLAWIDSKSRHLQKEAIALSRELDNLTGTGGGMRR